MRTDEEKRGCHLYKGEQDSFLLLYLPQQGHELSRFGNHKFGRIEARPKGKRGSRWEEWEEASRAEAR